MDKAVYDDLMHVEFGISDLSGAVTDAPGYGPMNIYDRVVGLSAMIAIGEALHHRHMTDGDQAAEVPKFETMVQFVLADHRGGYAFDPPIGRMSYRCLMLCERGLYSIKDGYLKIVVRTDCHWHAFGRLIGVAEILETDLWSASKNGRTENAELADHLHATHLPSRTTDEWIELFQANEIPVAAVNSIEDLFDDPRLAAVRLVETPERPMEGALVRTGFVGRFIAAPPRSAALLLISKNILKIYCPNRAKSPHALINGHSTTMTGDVDV